MKVGSRSIFSSAAAFAAAFSFLLTLIAPAAMSQRIGDADAYAEGVFIEEPLSSPREREHGRREGGDNFEPAPGGGAGASYRCSP